MKEEEKTISTELSVEQIKKLNLWEKLLFIGNEIGVIIKDNKMVNGQYKAVRHDQVTKAVRPYMVKYRVYYKVDVTKHLQEGNRTEADLEITFINVDNLEERDVVHAFGQGIDTQDKGPGKAVSYGVKVGLLKTLGLETGEDSDDGNEEFDNGKNTPPKSISPKVKAPTKLTKKLTKEEIEAKLDQYEKKVKQIDATKPLSADDHADLTTKVVFLNKYVQESKVGDDLKDRAQALADSIV